MTTPPELPVYLLLALGLIVSAAEPMINPTKHPHLMLVVVKHLPGITIYDADTGKPFCNATMGISPHEAAFSRDGRFAYVPIYGSSGVGQPGTNEHMLHFISTSDCKIVFSLDTGKYERPHGIEVGRETGTIYLTSEIAQSVILVDPKEHRIIAAIPTGSPYSHMLAVTRDEKTAYTANVQSKTVSVLNVPERKLAEVVPTGSPDQRMTLSPYERWFVTNLGPAHKIAFFRTSDNKLDFTVDVDGSPFVAKFSADGKYLYDGGNKDGRIRAWKIDVAQRKVVAIASDDLGTDIGSLAVNPFNHDVYVSDQPGNKISQIDPETWRVKKQLTTAKTPDCMVFAAVE